MTTTELPDPPGGFTSYGVTIYELGDEGEFIVAFGHHDELRFLATCNRYAREVADLDGIFDDKTVSFESAVSDIAWREVVLDAEQTDDTEWSLHWADQKLDKPDGDPVPVTVLTRW